MLEQEILKARKSIRGEVERYVFDAFLVPLQELQITEKEQQCWIRDAKRLSGKIMWFTYDSTRESFLKCAGELLKGACLEKPVSDGYLDRMYVRFMEGRIRFFQDREKKENCALPPVEVGKLDFHNTEMAAVFAHMKEDPDTVKFLAELDVCWTYEQLHMVSWFSGQLSLGSGDYSRSRPNHSARVTYGRLLNPYSLVWIAAVLGEDRELIRQVVNASFAGHRRKFKDRVIIIRNFIPFKRIFRLALPLVEEERNRLVERAG